MWAYAPFASSNDVGTSTNVTLTASYLAIQSPVGVMLEFDASGERWRVVSEMSVQRLDTDAELGLTGVRRRADVLEGHAAAVDQWSGRRSQGPPAGPPTTPCRGRWSSM